MAEDAANAVERVDGRLFVDWFLDILLEGGIRDVFGIPGGLVHPFVAAAERDPRVRLHVTRHEEGAAFMADGLARVTGRTAVCVGTSGPGATNLVTGVACAFADGVPMLVLTGQASTSTLGRGAAQETPRQGIDVVGMFGPITRYSASVDRAGDLALHLRRALQLAHSGRKGPVHLNVPVDLWGTRVDDPPRSGWPLGFVPATCDPDAAAQAAELLARARRPVLLVGSGAWAAGAHAEVAQLASLLPARMVTTPRAKAMEDHPHSLGVFGFGGHPAARALLLGPEPDVLFVIGSSLGETASFTFDRRLARGRRLLQVDIDPDRIGRTYPIDLPLVGDVRATLRSMLSCLRGRKTASEWEYAPPPPSGEERFDDRALRASEQVPVTPQRWRRDLDEALPDDVVLFSDIGGHMLFNLHHLFMSSGRRFFLNLGFGSMGHGTAAPVGAALGEPGRPVVAIVGDACFTMNGMEMITAVEYGAPVVWIVENNQMHGIIWHGSRLLGDGRPMECIRGRAPPDLRGMARAMGLGVWRVAEPGAIVPAVREALDARRPGMIEVMVDGSVSPPLADRARTIAGGGFPGGMGDRPKS